jgi:hypothetical protein
MNYRVAYMCWDPRLPTEDPFTLGAKGDVLTQNIASTLLVLGQWANTIPNQHMPGLF